MRNTLKRVCGRYYANGIEFDTFREALTYLWDK